MYYNYGDNPSTIKKKTKYPKFLAIAIVLKVQITFITIIVIFSHAVQ